MVSWREGVVTAPSWTYLYVVYRIDTLATDVGDAVTIKEVLPSAEQAEAEVARLNRLSEGKSWRYGYQNARYYARGRGPGGEGSEDSVSSP